MIAVWQYSLFHCISAQSLWQRSRTRRRFRDFADYFFHSIPFSHTVAFAAVLFVVSFAVSFVDFFAVLFTIHLCSGKFNFRLPAYFQSQWGGDVTVRAIIVLLSARELDFWVTEYYYIQRVIVIGHECITTMLTIVQLVGQ